MLKIYRSGYVELKVVNFKNIEKKVLNFQKISLANLQIHTIILKESVTTNFYTVYNIIYNKYKP